MSTAGGTPMPAGLGRLFRTALFIVPIGVLGNVAFSLLVTDRTLLATLDDFPVRYLALAVLLGLVPWFTQALRLLIWTRFLGHDVHFRHAFQMSLALDLGSAVTPTAVGGGFFKWGMLVQRGISPGAAASLSTLASIEDGVFFAIALPVAAILSASWDLPVLRQLLGELRPDALPLVLSMVAVAVLTWIAVRTTLGGGLGAHTQRRSLHLVARVRRRLRALWHDAREVFQLVARDGKWRFAQSLGLTAVQWICRYSVISALLAFLDVPLEPVLFWMLQWVVFTLMNLVPTPGAAGGAEAAFYIVYTPFLPEGVAGLATAGWRFLTFYMQLALAAVLFFILDLHARRRG